MKKKLYILIYAIVFIILIKFLSTYIVNQKLISEYNSNNYNEALAKKLFVANISESYIAYYNYGNVLYQNEKYEEAKENYQEALKHHPKKSRICSIRINLSLSMIKLSNNDPDKLKEAREVLYEDDCAHEEDDNGKSSKAEELEQQIKEQEQKSSSSSDDNNKEEQQEQEEDDDKKEQLEKQQQQGQKERQEDLDEAEGFGDYDFYNGKKW